jgi:hypothetical protein
MADDAVKVVLFGPDGEVETPWAVALGDDLYELDNTPWFAYGVSWKDVIEARPPAPGEFPEFVRVVRKSGYRTVRVMLASPADQSAESRSLLGRLNELGCTYEKLNQRFISIDVPPAVDLMVIREFLISSGQEWEHADPTYEQLGFGDPQS